MIFKKSILIFLSLCSFFVYAQKSKYNFKKIDSIGKAIDLSIMNLDGTYFNSIFDLDEFFLKVFDKESEQKLTAYEKEFKIGGKSKLNIPKIIFKAIGENGSYDYLKFYLDQNKNFHIIFRLSGDDGLNYHDFLIKEKEGRFVITDFLVYLSGEFLSVTMGNLYRNLIFEKKLEKKNQRYLNSIIKSIQIRILFGKEEYKKAYKLLEEIPKEILKNKLFQILILEIAVNISDEEYLNALNEYEKLYPNDRSLNLISIDATILRKEYDKTLFYINRLDEILDGDSYLNLYRGAVYFYKEDYKTAISYYETVKENFPYVEVTYDNLLYSYMELNQFDLATKIVEDFIEIFNYIEVEIIEYIKKDYRKLYKSKTFKKWLKERKSIDKN